MRGVLHADGGARGNPGPAGIGVVLENDSGEVVERIGRGIGVATNNVAEYQALISGLELALTRGVTEIQVFLDSELVVSQVKGEWKIKKDSLRTLAARASSLLQQFDSFTIAHVPREKNADADKLANEGMDEAEAELGDSYGGPEQASFLD